jgi:hypothetical protein
MHTVLSSLELLGMAIDDDDRSSAADLLQMAESGGQTLRSILDDVLDFGKGAQTNGGRSSQCEVDLVKKWCYSHSLPSSMLSTCRSNSREGGICLCPGFNR